MRGKGQPNYSSSRQRSTLHIAKVVKMYLERHDWKMLPHPLYSPEIALSDYYLFRLMSYALAEKRFQYFKDIKKWVDSWIASKDKVFSQWNP